MLLFIVARDHAERYEDLKRSLAGTRNVRVIVDRRGHLEDPPPGSRWREDERRCRAHVSRELKLLGWSVIDTDERE